MSGPTSDVNSSLKLVDEVVRAGAGAGKTTTLTQKVLDTADRFYASHGRWPHIVVTTFTRKATQELRERLVLRAYDYSSEMIDFVTSPSLLQISTIHGVLSLYLTRYGEILGLDPSFKVVDEAQLRQGLKRILRDQLVAKPQWQNWLEIYDLDRLSGILEELLRRRKQFAEAHPYTVEDLTALAQKQVQGLVKELFELADEIQREADSESKDGVKWLEQADLIQKSAMLFENQNWGNAREKVQGLWQGYRSPPSKRKEKYYVSDEVGEKSKKLRAKIKKFESDEWNPQNWKSFVEVFRRLDELASEIERDFDQWKQNSGYLGLEDLELFSLQGLRNHPQTGKAFSRQWDYWLIDEYQDTSPVQVELLKSLVGDRPHFVVGDPQQSIYLFRGARSEVFLNKEKELEDKGLLPSYLQKNYRSDPALLVFFNDFLIRQSEQFRPMVPREEPDARAKPLVATFASGQKREDEKGSLCEEERMACVEQVGKLIEAGIRPDAICLLGRTNAVLQKMAKTLIERGFPVHVHAASGFYQRREVLDALSLLKFLVNPHDNLNFLTLLRSPWLKVGDQNLVELAQASVEEVRHSYWLKWQRLLVDSEVPSPVFEQLLEWQKLCISDGVIHTWQRALIESGLMDHSLKIDPTGRREANIWKLIQQLHELERQPGFRLLEWMDQTNKDLTDIENQSEADAVAVLEPNRINLMTVHSSKGLQFDHVLIPGLGQKAPPRKRPDFSFSEEDCRWCIPVKNPETDQLEHSFVAGLIADRWKVWGAAEIQRLMYVALTRAKKSVFLSWTEPVARLSLVDQFIWDLSEGLHEREFYSYEVKSGPYQEKSYALGDAEKVSLRQPWRIKEEKEQRGTKVARQISVSRLLDEKKAEIETASLESENPQELTTSGLQLRAERAQDGVIMHKLFESLRYKSKEDVIASLPRWFAGKEERVIGVIDFLFQTKDLPFAEILENGKAEWGFLYQHGQITLEGQIDLWGVSADGKKAWVIDYKTGSAAGIDRAFEQLDLYSLAVRQMAPKAEVFCAVAYPFQRKIEQRPATSVEKLHQKYFDSMP